MIDPVDFREHVIRPTLKRLGLWSLAAENLMLGTALVESELRYLAQHNGPALGVYQVEPATHADLWKSYLAYRPTLAASVWRLSVPVVATAEQMAWNLAYATAIARLVYWRRPDPLPDADDIDGLAAYWKANFNTHAGKGDPAKFIRMWRLYAR